MSQSTSSLPVVYRIAPARAWVPLDLREIWAFRELLYFFTWREVRVRYKQAALGVAWAVIQPVATMIVFSVFFGRLAKIPSEGLPYPVFAFAALIPWQLFAFALTEASNSVVTNQRIVTKVYFPRVIMPMAAVTVGLVDVGISLGVLAVLLAYYGVVPGAAIVALPVWIVLAAMTALSIGLWLSALNVRYRDVRYTLPFVTQLWMLATPVAYPASMVPESWRTLYALNPMVGVIEGFRWSLLGVGNGPGWSVAVSAGAVAVLLASGLYYFRRVERTFADII